MWNIRSTFGGAGGGLGAGGAIYVGGNWLIWGEAMKLNMSFVVASVILIALAAGDASGATIYVTITDPGIGTGACSLQEAIYSSVLHDTLDGVHGIAIDATDPDHFITTGCVLGTGNDTIVLPTNGLLKMSHYLDGDAYNPVGPTATPVICCSTITIEGNGATLQWDSNATDNVRLFAVIGDSVKANGGDEIKTPNGAASGVGNLTIRNVYIKGFHVKGGDGYCGGGGGMGAGGAIYVWDSNLTVENSTFESNQATNGSGTIFAPGLGIWCPGELYPDFGGGGGIWGNGGAGAPGGGAGGGGSKGNGGVAALDAGGGGGGGTVFTGGNANGNTGGASGYFCGGNGGDQAFLGNDGHQAQCPGGGGGGAGASTGCGANGGDGNYGGGGGGGDPASTGESICNGDGGRGGFAGGGGAGGGTGGSGGFGGGGAVGFSGSGKGGFFAGDGKHDAQDLIDYGGDGAALGGAIFNDNGTVVIRNSTFAFNKVLNNGVGAAIFSHDGSLTIENSTISQNCGGNDCSISGAGLVVFGEHSASLTLNNTIIAKNAPTCCGTDLDTGECYIQGTVTAQGAGNLIIDNTPPKNNYATPSNTSSTGGGAMLACPGVVTSADPQLGGLSISNGGPTPTMSIPFGSVAMGSADSATSIALDQRGVQRPQGGGYDIGSFEVCREKILQITEPAPCSYTTAQEPPITLKIQLGGNGGGTTVPAPGTYSEPTNSVIVLNATPSSGSYFTGWAGNVAVPSSASTTITMDVPQAIAANFQYHDFGLLLNPTTLTIPIGGVGSSAATAVSGGDFADKVTLSASGTPAGVSPTFSSNPVTPTVGGSASSIVKLTIGASATPQTFTETITGNSTGLSGALTHSVPLSVTVVATSAALVNVINQDQTLGCIDRSGIAQSLTAKVNAYQTLVAGGYLQSATNVLSAFQSEVQGQNGKHIANTCTDPVGSNAFYTGQTLIADAQSLQTTLGANTSPTPIVGSVINSTGNGIGGATVNLVNSSKKIVATATTDAVGFYYFGGTNNLIAGANYTITVSIPKGYKSSTPATQALKWSSSLTTVGTIVLN